MTVEGFACPLRMALGIDMKNNSCNFTPVCVVSIGVQQPEIGDDMLLIIGCQYGIIRCQVSNIGI